MNIVLKRVISAFLTVLMFSCVFVNTAFATKMVKSGDVNGDSNISAADARLALRISAQIENATWLMRQYADVDGNKKVSAADARKILRAAANLEDKNSFAEFDEDDIPEDEIPVLSTDTFEYHLYEGEMGRFDVSVIDTPENFLWRSSDSSVAKVNDDGVVTAVKKGFACIIAEYGEDIYCWDLRVRNETQRKIYALQDKYPAGYYWNNHTPSEKYPEVSEIPCDDHEAQKWEYCKGQCWGFATLMFEEVHGKNMYTYGKKGVTWDTVKIGDHVRLAKNHSIFVTDIIEVGDAISYNPYSNETYRAEEKMLIVVHCNWGWNCNIIWDDVFTESYAIASEYSYTM